MYYHLIWQLHAVQLQLYTIHYLSLKNHLLGNAFIVTDYFLNMTVQLFIKALHKE
jgi:hypothetical protein